VWVELQLLRTTHVRCLEVIHKAAERNTAARINSDKLTEPIIYAFTNIYHWDKQQPAYIIRSISHRNARKINLPISARAS